MGRLGVTYEQFSEAANEVLTTGQFPTIEKVRLVLGVGSNTTLNAYINRWKDEFIKNNLAGTKASTIPDPVQRVVNEVWETLRAESKAEMERVQQEAQIAVQAAEEAKVIAAQQSIALQAQVDKLNLSLNHAQANFKMLQEEMIEMRQRYAVAEERAQASENKEKTLRDDTHRRLRELEQSQQHHLQQLEQQFKAREVQYQHDINDLKSALEKQRQNYIVELDNYKVAKNNAEKAQLKAQTELSQQRERYQELAERHKTVEFDLTLVRQHQQEAEKALIVCQTEIKLKNSLIEEYQQKMEALTEQIGEFKAKINRQNTK